MRSRRSVSVVAGLSSLAVAAGLLVGAPVATAGPTAGMLVASAIAPRTWSSSGVVTSYVYGIEFRAQAGMVESDIGVRRVGDSLVVFEELGGPSLGVADSTYCKGNNPSGLSSEVTCTFPSPLPNSEWIALGDFRNAPRGASLIIEEGSQVKGSFTGSRFDDYFQGGDLADTATGGAGEDNLYGGKSADELWGDAGADDMEGEAGDDRVWGGSEADNIIGGPDSDQIWGGSGADVIDALDKAADTIDCGVGEVASNNELEFDVGLDSPVNCGTKEWPSTLVPPNVSSTWLKVGETVTGTKGEWTGTNPILYGYTFERCPSSFDQGANACVQVKKGTLDAKGMATGGKPPFYTVTRADQGSRLRYTVSASNTTVKGGGTSYASVVTAQIAAPPAVTLPASWLPRQQGGSWAITQIADVQAMLEKSAIGPFIDIVASPVRRSKVPKPYQKEMPHGGVISIEVNGKSLTANMRVEGAPDERPQIKISYYSWFEDRKTCPIQDDGLALLQQIVSTKQGIPLFGLTTFLDEFPDGKCPWIIDWTSQVAEQTTFMATGVALEETGDPETPVRLRISASEPSLRSGLSVVVGAPPNAAVQQRPEDFSIGADGRLYVFPGDTHTSLWVGLLGDQVRESGKYGIVEFYVNGDRKLVESFRSASGNTTPYSTVLTSLLKETGTARIVISTLANTPGPEKIIESQVFLDFDIARASSWNEAYLVTWDGRCFTPSGSRGSCPDAVVEELAAMKDSVGRSINNALNTFPYAWDALRYASAELDKRFVAIGANGTISRPRSGATLRYESCWFGDLFCHGRNFIEAAGNLLARPKPPPKAAPKPKPPLRLMVRLRVIPVGKGTAAGGVVGEGMLKIPGVGLLNLDGGTLLNLDGGTLLSDQGAGLLAEFAQLLNLDGGTLLNLDGGTLLNLDGGTIVGIDPASVVGLNTGTLLSDMGGAFSPVVMVSLQRVR